MWVFHVTTKTQYNKTSGLHIPKKMVCACGVCVWCPFHLLPWASVCIWQMGGRPLWTHTQRKKPQLASSMVYLWLYHRRKTWWTASRCHDVFFEVLLHWKTHAQAEKKYGKNETAKTTESVMDKHNGALENTLKLLFTSTEHRCTTERRRNC